MSWIRQTSAIPCYFRTWAEEYNEQFQKEMSSRYRKLAERHNCLVAPIGEKWWERIHEDPSVDLYFKDRRHASPAGSKLAAQVIFDTIKEKIDEILEMLKG